MSNSSKRPLDYEKAWAERRERDRKYILAKMQVAG